MLVARRPVSMGDTVFQAGEPITREAQKQLPPGRMAQLLTHGWVEELADDAANARHIEDLQERVAALEEAVKLFRAQIGRVRTTKGGVTNG